MLHTGKRPRTAILFARPEITHMHSATCGGTQGLGKPDDKLSGQANVTWAGMAGLSNSIDVPSDSERLIREQGRSTTSRRRQLTFPPGADEAQRD